MFLIALIYCITDVDSIISSPAGALLEILYQATRGSTKVALFLEVFPVMSMLFAAQAVLTTSSRMTASPILSPSVVHWLIYRVQRRDLMIWANLCHA